MIQKSIKISRKKINKILIFIEDMLWKSYPSLRSENEIIIFDNTYERAQVNTCSVLIFNKKQKKKVSNYANNLNCSIKIFECNDCGHEITRYIDDISGKGECYVMRCRQCNNYRYCPLTDQTGMSILYSFKSFLKPLIVTWG